MTKFQVIKRDRFTEILITFGIILYVVIGITVIVLPFRIYSSSNALASMTTPRVKHDLDPPYNLPLLQTDSTIKLEKELPGIHIDLGTVITGELFGWARPSIAEGDVVLIPYQDSPVSVRIQFPRGFETLGGNWRGEGARLITTGAVEGTFEGTPGNQDKTWGGTFGVSSNLKKVSPYFDIDLPLDEVNPQDELVQRKISVEVELDIAYPSIAGTSTYEDRSGTLRHHFEMTVLKPDEVSKYQDIRGAYLARQVPLVVLAWVGVLSVEILILLLVRKVVQARGDKN
jgi:hypothetical protein